MSLQTTQRPVAAAPGTVHLGIAGPVAVIVLDNPPLNLLTMAMRTEIERIAVELAESEEVRAVMVTAAGERSFSSGSDVREFPADAIAGRERADAEHACLDALEAMPQPTVAALRGHVLGGGLELALACDFRVVAQDARLGLPEGRLGVFPCGGGTQRLPRLIGEAMAKELILLGDAVTAEEALRLRLVHRVVPGDDVETAARELAERLAAKPRLAVQAAKRAIAAGILQGADEGRETEAEEAAHVFASRDAQEGRAAFLEKREPRFEHR
ncbi:MAG: enoyl-CoA hydratase [Conexibacter sp.]|nr:enoyl-CoA hydratase [Conexibacter sp.]